MSSSVAIEEYKGLLSFRINRNEYLDKQINAYAHGYIFRIEVHILEI